MTRKDENKVGAHKKNIQLYLWFTCKHISGPVKRNIMTQVDGFNGIKKKPRNIDDILTKCSQKNFKADI